MIASTRSILLLASLAAACSGAPDAGDPCQPEDADGIIGGNDTFEVTVTDEAFAPRILSSQNRTEVTLRLTNAGLAPHGFAVSCLPTPNSDGCPQESCFPEEATIAPLEPGETATARFEVPLVEGIHEITTGVAEDVFSAQFIVQ